MIKSNSQFSWQYWTKWCMPCFTALLESSDPTFVLRWYIVDRCSQIQRCLLSSFVICDMKILPQSNKLIFEALCNSQTSFNIKSSSFLADIFTLHGPKWAILDNWSITVNKQSNLFDTGRPSIKQQLLYFHGPAVIGSWSSVPNGFWVSDLSVGMNLIHQLLCSHMQASTAKWIYDILMQVYFPSLEYQTAFSCVHFSGHALWSDHCLFLQFGVCCTMSSL